MRSHKKIKDFSAILLWLLNIFLRTEHLANGQWHSEFFHFHDLLKCKCVRSCSRNGFIFSCGENFAAGATMHVWSLDWGSHPRASI